MKCRVTDDRKYPGHFVEAPLETLKGRLTFVWATLIEFAFKHTFSAEIKRILVVLYEAVYSTIPSE